MRLILHIGIEKTGTTSLQHWFHVNSAALIRNRIWYSACLGRPNNRLVSVYARDSDKPDDGFFQNGIADVAQHAAFRLKIEREFRAEVAEARACGCTTFVISNEHCHSRLISADMVARVRDLVGDHFTDIEIYCFLRPQIDVALSLSSTAARLGTQVDRPWFDAAMRRGNLYFDFQSLVTRWATQFGTEAMRVLPFRPRINFVQAFLEFTAIDTTGCVDIPSKNEPVDVRAIAIANSLDLPRFDAKNQPNRNRNFFIDSMPFAEKLSIDRAFAETLQARFTASNAALVEAWPSVTMADLTPNWNAYPEQGNLDLLETAKIFAPQLRYMVERFNAELWMERARRFAGEADAAENAGRVLDGIKHCETAIAAASNALNVAATKTIAKRFVAGWEHRLKKLRRQSKGAGLPADPAAPGGDRAAKASAPSGRP